MVSHDLATVNRLPADMLIQGYRDLPLTTPKGRAFARVANMKRLCSAYKPYIR